MSLWIRLEMCTCTCKISRWRIDSGMDRCASSSAILRTRSDRHANMAAFWLRVLLWVTLPLLQCTVTHLYSMQNSLCAQLVADHCHISQWENINRKKENKMIISVHDKLSFFVGNVCKKLRIILTYNLKEEETGESKYIKVNLWFFYNTRPYM